MRKELKSNYETYEYCFVPDCTSTTRTAPHKVFVTVPRDLLKRQRWCDAVESPGKKAKKSRYCCEDHFDLKNDMENYCEWREKGVQKKLKSSVLARRTLNFDRTPSELSSVGTNNPDCNQAFDADCATVFTDFAIAPAIPTISTFNATDADMVSIPNNQVTQCEPNVEHPPIQTKITKYKERATQCELDMEHKHVQTEITTYVKSTQTNPVPRTRTLEKGIQYSFELTPPKNLDKLTESVKKMTVSDNLNATTDSIPSEILDAGSSYHPSTEKTSSNSYEKNLQIELMRADIYEKFTKPMIEHDPSPFIGLDKENLYVLHLLHEDTSLSFRDIHLVLKKIRTNLPFNILGYYFSVSASQAARIFEKSVDKMAAFFKQLIIWLKEDDIRFNLPITFRYRYSNVQSIIDCFEIEIEKPSNALFQALSWSDYKKCNSVKYLISVTADGLITLISDGVAGRATDVSVVENCGYLDVLPGGCSVLADRGFKLLDLLLQKKKCKLIRPPSVQKETKISKKEVKLTKQIASIRIHVERAINRIRNYRILDIHARIDNHLIGHLDSMVNIVCGLVNLQSPIIKQTNI
ncbi:hypothetical protein QAD02_012937 [Eretmocerus hayati]|uniref:Uncharacterized protein n=1 Tax=Eretmocerus hayati TaxID=131215 RepID=A0ACC2P156_9HYME|nr:hypothetical protein QAD02_012937 [Eretmocerus hayati]